MRRSKSVEGLDLLEHEENNADELNEKAKEEDEGSVYEEVDELYDFVRGIKSNPPSSRVPSTTLVTISTSGLDVIAQVTQQGSKQPQFQRHCSLPSGTIIHFAFLFKQLLR